jgi:UDP-N-acetylglucosamine/UDP-N-acetylgalactosamine diphosphorylase
MTSIDTDDKTQAFFRDHSYFGLNAQDVIFFQQGLLPCLTKEGLIMLESAGRVAMAPDGNGGLYQGRDPTLAPNCGRRSTLTSHTRTHARAHTALDKCGILQDMRSYGVEYLFQYCVDNILIKMVDPVFMGFLYESEADVGCKVAPKVPRKPPPHVLCYQPLMVIHRRMDGRN